jgi:hypothetical protein
MVIPGVADRVTRRGNWRKRVFFATMTIALTLAADDQAKLFSALLSN